MCAKIVLPEECQLWRLDLEVEALAPVGVESVVRDGLRLELGRVILCAKDLNLHKRGNHSAATSSRC